MLRAQPTPGYTPSLVLCADGGGSKVCVVIRTADGLEVRGTAGPCNVQSVGFSNAAQAILLATYRALALLPLSYLPSGFTIPPLPDQTSPSTTGHHSHPSPKFPDTPYTSRAPSPGLMLPLRPINAPLFASAWLGLAGVNTTADVRAFTPYIPQILNIPVEKLKVSNDVNLLAAPALTLPGIRHVVAVVCGTGTVGRTLRLRDPDPSQPKQLPLEDVAVSRGWGYLLCDEGSAFWIGRLAVRMLLSHADRIASADVHSTPCPPLLPFHKDLLRYFEVTDPMDLIELIQHTGRWIDSADAGGAADAGQVASRRNAMLAGAARIVLRWAFPEEANSQLPSPPSSNTSLPSEKDAGLANGTEDAEMETVDPIALSQREALALAKRAVAPLVDLTLSLLGDRTVVRPDRSVLCLGGGLMMSKGYRGLLLEALRKEGVDWGSVQVVTDAAGVGATGLAAVEFGLQGGNNAV